MKYFLTLALLIFTSCSGLTGRTFNELHSGMPQDEAMLKLGEPDSVTHKGDMEMHKYCNLYGPKIDDCKTCSNDIAKCDYYVVYQNGKILKYGSMNHK